MRITLQFMLTTTTFCPYPGGLHGIWSKLLRKNWQMCNPGIWNVIISFMQFMFLSSTVRDITNEMLKISKYLTHKTDSSSSPKWNVKIRDNQINNCLNFKICMSEISCCNPTNCSSFTYSLSLSLLPSLSLSLSLSIQFRVSIQFFSVEKNIAVLSGVMLVRWTAPVPWLQYNGTF
jgi:hypothetical protein